MWDEGAEAFKLALALKTTTEGAHGLGLAGVHSAYDAGRAAFERRDFATAKDKFKQVLKSETTLKDEDIAPLFADAKAKSKQISTELLLNAGIDRSEAR